MPQRPMSPQLQAASALLMPHSGQATDGVFRPNLSALERMIIGKMGGPGIPAGAPLSNAQRNLLVQAGETAAQERIAQADIEARPNRTPSAALLARLGLGGGEGGDGTPSRPPMPALPPLPDQPALPSLSGTPAAATPLITGRSGPERLLNNTPPPRRRPGTSKLSEFLRQNSRIR